MDKVMSGAIGGLVGMLITFMFLTTFNLSKIKDKINLQTTLLKNVSEQLSELRSDFTVLPNPEGWNESEVNKSEEK